ncbi:hypothetical protein EGI26_13415 [Lacihabitans sp. CCS-44]|uniref:PQQ-like beta-propeller repeat protein n=1 Tax=Lacihabitans sp. CCS-44 TaxID=2487331 RepID=UPI0020CD6637|nr:PQQ-like beta-propeller repeat protein [Lacihabitans sp. CCS-44]MCP9756155.1 hypothetical protein [Lacihabitans sp. CCS-44]
MKYLDEIKDIKALTIFKNEVLTFGENGDIKTKGLDLLPLVNNSQCLYWKNDFENITYLNDSLNEIEFEGFSGGYIFKNGFLVIERTSKKYYCLESGKMGQFGIYLPFSKPLFGNYFIKMQINTEIGIYDYPNYLWQVDISKYGKRRLNHHGEEIDTDTPNTVSGEIMGYDDTVVVPLAGGQLLGLNIQDGSFKWILEFEKKQSSVIQNESKVITFSRDILWEIDLKSGQIIFEYDISEIFKLKFNQWPNNVQFSNGKLIIDFLSKDDSLVLIDLNDLRNNEYSIFNVSNAFLKARKGDVIFFQNQLYARDSLSNTLYIFGE